MQRLRYSRYFKVFVIYVRNWSFSMDIVIILKTIFLVIVGDKNAR